MYPVCSGYTTGRSGSTCTSVLIREDRIISANVGDSRALLIRSGKGIELTQDHRPLNSNRKGKNEMERITTAGGWQGLASVHLSA